MHPNTGSNDGPTPRHQAVAAFHPADLLYVLEWAAIAPGLGGWTVRLDDPTHVLLVSVVPPGAEQPAFFITRSGRDVVLAWLPPKTGVSELAEIGRFVSLRAAVLALCPLDADQMSELNAAMELLYPRSLRTG